MAFSKSFAREVPGSNMPRWEEIFLTAQEEREREQVARQENMYLMRQCIADAKVVVKNEKMMDIQSHILSIAMCLFKKRASHAVFYKEERCKDKFQRHFGILQGLKDSRSLAVKAPKKIGSEKKAEEQKKSKEKK
ncbi:TPA: hypothetical protein HA265_07255 [Candidatus Woesearchaeota archaeon]|nr:hypothetical protein [Candidatus Woesearchaeota archaeon]